MKSLCITILLFISLTAYAPNLNVNYKAFELFRLKNSELTIENVKKYIELLEIKHKDIVLKQFILETGWGKSYVCRTYNNLFGFMGYSKKFNKYIYFKYNHWTESIERYKAFQDRKYKGGCYFLFLQQIGYAEAVNYVEVLKKIKV